MLLIVENDIAFARFLLEAVREQGCKGLVTSQGAGALALARDYMPDAITLDIVLADMDGWRVMDRLKHDLSTRHIPICVVSTEDARERALDAGARSFIAKPIPSKARARRRRCRTCLPASGGRRKRVIVVEARRQRSTLIDHAVVGDDLIVSKETFAAMLDGRSLAQNADCLIIDGRARASTSMRSRAPCREPVAGSAACP